MATLNSYAHGQFCWVDLMARDMRAIKPFYENLLGWSSVDQDTQGGPPYAIFEFEGQQTAGLGEMNDEMKASGMPPVWNSYINVDDVSATVEKAVSLGAQVVMPPMQVVDAGHMAIIQDPTGAFVSFWQKINHFGAHFVNDIGGWCWNDLLTPNPQASIDFYSGLFGWKVEKQEDSPNNYWIAHNNDRMNCGIMEITPDMGECPPHWSIYFTVNDINGVTDFVRQAGGQVLNGPFEVPVGHMSVVTDPQGAAFQMIQLTVPVDQ